MRSLTHRAMRFGSKVHLSTYVVLLSGTVALTLIIVPGSYLGRSGGFGCSLAGGCMSFESDNYEHGWPITFLKRDAEAGDYREDAFDQPAWAAAANWAIMRGDLQFSLGALAFDMAVACGLLIVLGAGVEWWRRRRQHLWQIGLRELALLVAFTSAVLAWWQGHRQRWINEQVAGFSEDDIGFDGTRWIGPNWLPKLVGRWHWMDVFETVDELSYHRCRDTDLEQFGASLQQLPNLRVLDLGYCDQVTNRGLAYIPTLHRLEVLRLENASITNNGLRRLLEHLNPAHLRELTVSGDHITSKGFSTLGRFDHLQVLTIRGPNIADALVPYIVTLSDLRHLDLEDTRITDEGLSQLTKLSQLEELSVYGTRVTEEGVERLRESLRNCRIGS